VSAIEFPSNPILNQEHTHDGVVWKCEEDTHPIWSPKNPDYLPIDGSKSMTGQLSILPSAPTDPSHAVRKDYADTVSELIVAIDKEINVNSIIDVFIYDTALDPDASWINLSNIDFPKVSLMTLENNLLTIYDANDFSLPVIKTIVVNSAKVVHAKQGKIYVGGTGLKSFDIVTDYTEQDLASLIVNPTVNKVASTSDALNNIIVAVATAGGVSIIKENNTSVHITFSTYTGNSYAGFNEAGKLFISADTGVGDLVLLKYDILPVTDLIDGWATLYSNSGQSPDLIIDPKADGVQEINFTWYTANNVLAIGYDKQLTLLQENTTNPSDGMVNFIAPDYNSGWQKGVIHGAWLADTDTRNLQDTELVLNGGFTSLDNWTKDGIGTLAIDSQRMLVTNNSSGSDRTIAYQVVNVEAGKGYRFAVEGTPSTINPTARIRDGSDINTGTILFDGPITSDYYVDIEALTGNFTISLRGEDTTGNGTTYYDNVSITAIDLDRSYRATNLKIVGSITRPQVNTGTELVACDNLSASNYLEQTDVRFVNTLFVYGWQKHAINGWEFKHGIASSNPIDGVTIAGNTFKVAGTLPKTLIRLGEELTEEQINYIVATENALFAENSNCTIQGTLPKIVTLGYSENDNVLVVCSENATTRFSSLTVVSNSTDISTSVYRSCGSKEMAGN